MEAKPTPAQSSEAVGNASRLLCFFCCRERKLTALSAELSPSDHTVIAEGVTYGVCPNHEKEYQDLKRRAVP